MTQLDITFYVVNNPCFKGRQNLEPFPINIYYLLSLSGQNPSSFFYLFKFKLSCKIYLLSILSIDT